MNVQITKYKIFTKKIVKKLEEKYNAKYIGDFDMKNGKSGLLFYQPFPNLELGHSNYFFLFISAENLYITNGEYMTDIVFNAVKSKRTYLISCYRHHYNEKDGIFIDGGRDYLRTNTDKIYQLKLENGEFKLI